MLNFGEIHCKQSFYLFYSNEKLKDLEFRVVKNTEVDEKNLLAIIKSQSFIKNVRRAGKNGDTLSLKLSFKSHPKADEFRKFLEYVGLISVKVNGQKIWVKNLITVEEAFAENAKYSPEPMNYKPEYADPNMPEYYDYELFRLKTKMKYMQTSAYPKYLYEGYVTKFQDAIDSILKDKEQYNISR
ncbi:MAG: hypothetical protein CVU05_13430 [Bacteroidetes bacterium HGW-Bacteroidetes-21]|jgi:hypothetical protein|nr:MAG: hypothetical protein CVU05_13430 [Bacteroidetes bacterium HGW-Bacteroidetes-21]